MLGTITTTPSFEKLLDDLIGSQLLEQTVRSFGIDPDDDVQLLDAAAVGVAQPMWRNTVVEDWHCSEWWLDDGEMMRGCDGDGASHTTGAGQSLEWPRAERHSKELERSDWLRRCGGLRRSVSSRRAHIGGWLRRLCPSRRAPLLGGASLHIEGLLS